MIDYPEDEPFHQNILTSLKRENEMLSFAATKVSNFSFGDEPKDEGAGELIWALDYLNLRFTALVENPPELMKDAVVDGKTISPREKRELEKAYAGLCHYETITKNRKPFKGKYAVTHIKPFLKDDIKKIRTRIRIVLDGGRMIL